MEISQRQNDIIIGLILGDGCLEKNGNNIRLRVEHGPNQEEYINWLYNELKEISCKPRIVLSKHSKVGKIYKKFHFSTLSKEYLNKYYLIFYKDKRKIVPENINKLLLSPLSLAIWFMDDGYKRNDCNALRISTDSFSYNEQLKLVQCIEQNFGITCKIHKKALTWNLYIPQKSANDFCEIIKPHVISSMKYKISLTP